ncbi:MAG: hypothetical protein JWM56_695 [Candidatus Peribacteria bacterium]|nr:hypothetical protein [Candidatus Peribacteria bacterium]
MSLDINSIGTEASHFGKRVRALEYFGQLICDANDGIHTSLIQLMHLSEELDEKLKNPAHYPRQSLEQIIQLDAYQPFAVIIHGIIHRANDALRAS